MAEFVPRNLTKKAVQQVFNDYLASMEVAQLQEYLRLWLADHAPDGQMELEDSHELVAAIEAERDRLVKLAKKGK